MRRRVDLAWIHAARLVAVAVQCCFRCPVRAVCPLAYGCAMLENERKPAKRSKQLAGSPPDLVSSVDPDTAAPPLPPRVAIVVSTYNVSITQKLLDGAIQAYASRATAAKVSGAESNQNNRRRSATPHRDETDWASSVDVWHVSGAFEILSAASSAVATGRYAAVVALGCIIRGETSHDRHLASAVTNGLAQLSLGGVQGLGGRGDGALSRPIAVGLGVLTVESVKQAKERAGGKLGNKGEEAMNAALDSFAVIERIRNGPQSPPVASLPSGPTADRRDKPNHRDRVAVHGAQLASGRAVPDKAEGS